MSAGASDREPGPAGPLKPRRRGAVFWLMLSFCLVAAAPVLIYLAGQAYVCWAFSANSLAQRASAFFDAPAHVGAVHRQWLKNMRVADIAVEGPDKSKLLTVDSVTLDWDIGALLAEGRIRSATIQRPQVALRRNAEGQWNLRVNLAAAESGYRVEQVVMREGDLTVEWPAPRAAGTGTGLPATLRLQALSGTFTDQGALMPKTFSLYGVFDSLESVQVNGGFGPGRTWFCRVKGGVRLEQDLAAALLPAPGAAPEPKQSISGRVRYDITGGTVPASDSTPEAQVSFGGQFSVEDLRWPLTAAWALDVPAKTLGLSGTARLDTDPETLASFDALQLRMDGLAALSGAGDLLLQPGPHIALRNVKGTLDTEPLNEMFRPRLWGEQFALKGSVAVSGMTATLPLTVDAPPFALSAQFSVSRARVALGNAGELPLCDADGTVAWPALKQVNVRLGDVGKAFFSVRDVCPQGGDFWLALASGLTVHNAELDIERFWETELGRRVMTATFDPAKPAPAGTALPYILKGRLTAWDVRPVVEPMPDRGTRITVGGLSLGGVSIVKWPFPFHAPARQFKGRLDVSTELAGGKVSAVKVNGELQSPAAPELGEIRMKVKHSYLPQEDEQRKIGAVEIADAVWPFEDLARIFDLRQCAGISGQGMVRIRRARFDPVTGDMSGTIELEDVALTIALSRDVQASILSVLKLSPYSFAAPVFERNPTDAVCLAGVKAQLQTDIKSRRLVLKGQTQPCALRAVLPSVGEKGLATLPPTDLELEVDLTPGPEGRSGRLVLSFQNKTRLEAAFKQALPQPQTAPEAAGEAWLVSGSLESPEWGGLSATADAAFDLGKREAGPVAIRIKDLDLAKATSLFVDSGIQQPAGHVRDLEIKLKEYSLKSLSAAKNWVVTGGFEGVQFSSGFADADRLTGEVRVVAASSSESLEFNSILRLRSYSALLGDGAFYIPPGQDGSLRLVGRYTKREKGADVRLDLLQMNLGDVKAEVAGGLTLEGAGLSKVALDDLRLHVPDMAQAWETYRKQNLEDRAPWFGDLRVAGMGGFNGRLSWAAGGPAAVEGRLGLDDGTLTVGKTTLLTLSKVIGEFPVMLRLGGVPSADKRAPAAELRGKLKVGSLRLVDKAASQAGGAGKEQQYASAQAHELTLVATPNTLAVETPIRLATPLGEQVLGGLAFRNMHLLFKEAREQTGGQTRERTGGEKQPEISFNLDGKVELDRLLRENALAIAGLEGLTLAGSLRDCRIVRTTGLRGPWELLSSGGPRGPFFGGEAIVENVKARGLFGPAPALGCDLRLYGEEGIKITQLAEKNPKWGKLAIRVNATLKGLEAASATLEGIQAFTLDVKSVDFVDRKTGVVVEEKYWFDGRFGMAIAPELMRQKVPKQFFGDDGTPMLTFGIDQLGMRFELAAEHVRGPVGLLDGGHTITGYGSQGLGVLSGFILNRLGIGSPPRVRFDDVMGTPENKIPWADIVKKLKQGAGR